MKRTLLSIGEVARLKGISRKALRYYERIGILVPAHTDPNTGYRYYALNQMIVVDVIVTCVELGIPLKTLTRFIRADGTLDIGSILEQGRTAALDTMRQAAASLTQIDRHLEETAAQKRIDHEKQPYERYMKPRRMLCVAWDAKDFDAKRYLALTTLLYEHAFHAADAHDGEPAYVHCRPHNAGAQAKNCVDTQGIALASLPGGKHRGQRIRAAGFEACFREVFRRAATVPGPLTATEIWDPEIDPADYAVELLEGPLL